MDAVFSVLKTVAGVVGGVFHAIGAALGLIVEILGEFGVLLFVAGFFGLLMAALWFIFRYIDKKRLTLPTVVFMLFFLLFLGGNVLMLAHDTHTRGAGEPAETAQQTELVEQAVV